MYSKVALYISEDRYENIHSRIEGCKALMVLGYTEIHKGYSEDQENPGGLFLFKNMPSNHNSAEIRCLFDIVLDGIKLEDFLLLMQGVDGTPDYVAGKAWNNGYNLRMVTEKYMSILNGKEKIKV